MADERAPVVVLLAALLVAGLVAVLAAERATGARTGSSQLFVRWRTWAVITPLAVAAAWTLASTVVFVALLAAQGAREHALLVGMTPVARRLLIVAAAATAPIVVAADVTVATVAVALLLAVAATAVVRADPDAGLRDLSGALFGWAWIALLLGNVVILRGHDLGGFTLVVALFAGVAVSDIGAFAVGSTVGRRYGSRPLSSLSPNKTRAGVAGNVIGAAVGVGAVASVAPLGLPLWAVATLPLLIAVGGVVGDLLESLLKRASGSKDAGAWLPGFGGLLDRIDSLVVAAPLLAGLVAALDLWLL